MSTQLLVMIFVMIMTYQIDQILSKFKLDMFITPNFFTVLLGLFLGIVAHWLYDEKSLGELRNFQPMAMQVLLVPPILFEA